MPRALRPWLTVAVVFQLLPSFVGHVRADTLLEVEQKTDLFEQEEVLKSSTTSRSVWIDGGRARIDGPDGSIILPATGDRLWFLDHEARTFETLRLPASLETLLDERELAALERAARHFEFLVDVEKLEEEGTVGEWTADVHRITAESSRLRFRAEVWTTPEVDVDEEPYRTILRSFNELNPVERWLNRILDVEGFLARVAIREFMPGGRTRLEATEVVSVAEAQPPNPEHYRPPADYREIPFDVSRLFLVSRGKAPP